MGLIRTLIGTVLLGLTGVLASTENSTIAISHHGFAALQAGQIVAGQWKNDKIEHVWQNNLIGGFSATAQVGPQLRVNVGVECLLAFGIMTENISYASNPESNRGQFLFYPNRLDGQYSLGDTAAGLTLGVGYFPFTYNRDVRNLGEYLFRAHCYPGYIINDFDAVYKRLLGIHAEGRLFGWLRQDLLLTSSIVDNPAQDFDLSYLVAAKAGHVAEFGAGISLEHFLSVNERMTTPKDAENAFIRNIDTVLVKDSNGQDSVASISGGDTSYYSFGGAKIMARVSFDPKRFFSSSHFGAEDLKMYAEGCILGVVDQGDFYDSILRRIPIAIGFNLPAFKVLDVLSLELEWYDSRYSNNYMNTYIKPKSLPTPVESEREPAKSDWYWSVYAKRTIMNGWSVTAQFAHDHIFSYNNSSQYKDHREALPNHGDWHWVIKTQFAF